MGDGVCGQVERLRRQLHACMLPIGLSHLVRSSYGVRVIRWWTTRPLS